MKLQLPCQKKYHANSCRLSPRCEQRGMYELFLHTQLFFFWCEYCLQHHAEMWQEIFFQRSCLHCFRSLAGDHTQTRGFVSVRETEEFQVSPLGKKGNK